MAYVSSLTVSSTSALLTALYSFVVTTLGWTPVASGVSGLAENFVARSSGASGDRMIVVKWGASIAAQSGISCFACLAFDSATSAANRPTTDVTLSTSGASASTVYFVGDANHVVIGVSTIVSATQTNVLIAGLPQAFFPIERARPNLTVVVNTLGILRASPTHGRVVEAAPGSFNQTINVNTFDNEVLNVNDPSPLDGQHYLWPLTVYQVAVERFYGVWSTVLAAGIGTSHGMVISAGSLTCVVFGNSAGTVLGTVALKLA